MCIYMYILYIHMYVCIKRFLFKFFSHAVMGADKSKSIGQASGAFIFQYESRILPLGNHSFCS